MAIHSRCVPTAQCVPVGDTAPEPNQTLVKTNPFALLRPRVLFPFHPLCADLRQGGKVQVMGSAPSMTSSVSVVAVSTAVGLGVGLGARLLRSRAPWGRWVPSAARAVVVTGCDRGLGYSLALHYRTLGLTVFAGVLDPASFGAQRLADVGVRVLPLDVTDSTSVLRAVTTVRKALSDDPQLSLAALVNNAGVLVFGEFGWQTSRQVRLQVDVNLVGTMRVSRAFLPLLRQQDDQGNRGRLVVVTSHCALAALPALSVYAATKAGLQSWADAVRMEQAQYGVPVVQVVPGSFTHLSGILAAHDQHAEEMGAAMNQDDRQFYGDYPRRFHAYLAQVSALSKQASESPSKLPDEALHAVFEDALLSRRPRHRYVHEPWRYTLYHSLIRMAPGPIRDWLAVRFASLPAYTGRAQS